MFLMCFFGCSLVILFDVVEGIGLDCEVGDGDERWIVDLIEYLFWDI